MNKNKFIDISKIDEKNSFLHYTNLKNIESIFTFGLEPRIGKNSMTIEKSKKIFFTIGFDNTLILMDAWIKWIVLRPRINFIYKCGLFFMTKSYFPKFIVDKIFEKWIKNKKRINYACNKLNKILNESVFLLLNLEENIDFNYNDIDEIKNQNFSKKQLKYIYTYHEKLNDNTMEKLYQFDYCNFVHWCDLDEWWEKRFEGPLSEVFGNSTRWSLMHDGFEFVKSVVFLSLKNHYVHEPNPDKVVFYNYKVFAPLRKEFHQMLKDSINDFDDKVAGDDMENPILSIALDVESYLTGGTYHSDDSIFETDISKTLRTKLERVLENMNYIS